MRESPEDLARLQPLLDASIANAGPFLRGSFEMPAHSLSAAQLTRALPGVQVVAVATTTASGEPRAAPIGAVFLRGRFHIPTTMTAARVRHVRRRPAVSLTHYRGIDFAVIAHGRGVVLDEDDPAFETLVGIQLEHGPESVRDWGAGAFVRVEPHALYTDARRPAEFPV